MNRMTPDLARLLVEEHLADAELRSQLPAGGPNPAPTVKVPRQRRAATLMKRLVPGYGMHVPTR